MKVALKSLKLTSAHTLLVKQTQTKFKLITTTLNKNQQSESIQPVLFILFLSHICILKLNEVALLVVGSHHASFPLYIAIFFNQ